MAALQRMRMMGPPLTAAVAVTALLWIAAPVSGTPTDFGERGPVAAVHQAAWDLTSSRPRSAPASSARLESLADRSIRLSRCADRLDPEERTDRAGSTS